MAVVAALLVAPAFGQNVIEQVVVNVNGDILTRRQVDERLRAVLAQETGHPVTLDDLHDDPHLAGRVAELTASVVSDAVDEMLVLQQARELGLDATDADVDAVVAGMRRDNHITGDESFAALLRAQGIDPSALRESVRRQILIEQVRQDAFHRVRVTEFEAEQYYRAHASEFDAGPRLSFHELLVALPPVPPPGTSNADDRYERGLMRFVHAEDRIHAGARFEEIAAETSDAASKAGAGAVGPVNPSTLPPEIRLALSRLRPGEVSPPIRTDDGYWLLRLDGVTPARPATFETFRADIVARLLAKRQVDAFRTLLDRLRAQALFAWKDESLHLAYEGYQRGQASPPGEPGGRSPSGSGAIRR